jgi:hypothetical protein
MHLPDYTNWIIPLRYVRYILWCIGEYISALVKSIVVMSKWRVEFILIYMVVQNEVISDWIISNQSEYQSQWHILKTPLYNLFWFWPNPSVSGTNQIWMSCILDIIGEVLSIIEPHSGGVIKPIKQSGQTGKWFQSFSQHSFFTIGNFRNTWNKGCVSWRLTLAWRFDNHVNLSWTRWLLAIYLHSDLKMLISIKVDKARLHIPASSYTSSLADTFANRYCVNLKLAQDDSH